MTSPAVLDERCFLVLNCIVLKKMATVGAVAQAVGLPYGTVENAVQELENSGDVVRIDAELLPMDSAVDRLDEYMEADCAPLRTDGDLERWHQRFEVTNRRFLQAVTEWQRKQIGDQTLANDHSDPEYDARVIAKVEAAVRGVSKLIDEVAPRIGRLTRYRERLDAALDKIEHGDLRHVSDPLVDSVHNAWFEFHEDILRILGKKRAE